MSEPRAYIIRTLADMFSVPAEKRAVMFRELELSMLLSELTFGDEAANALKSMTWVDDGDKSVTLSVNGDDMLKLEVTKEKSHE
jgi:hypothetical protein